MVTNSNPVSLRDQCLRAADLAMELAGFIQAKLPIVGEPWQGETAYHSEPAIAEEMVRRSVELKKCYEQLPGLRPLGKLFGPAMSLKAWADRMLVHYLGTPANAGEDGPDPLPIHRRLVWELGRAARRLRSAVDPAERNALLEAIDEGPHEGCAAVTPPPPTKPKGKRRGKTRRQQGDKKVGPLPIESLGTRNYRVGDRVQAVEPSEDAVLTAFAQRAGKNPMWIALDQNKLRDLSGYQTAPRILKKLTQKYTGLFAGSINCPGSRGQGGLKIYMQKPAKKPRK